MAKYIFGLLVLLVLCSSAFALQKISPDDPDYADLCPPDVKNTNVLTHDKCDLSTYVMCFKGKPLYAMKCSGRAPRFNVETNFCDYEGKVPLPRGCERQRPTEEPITSCSQGVLYITNPNTCRSYWVCQGDMKLEMFCNRFAYYIHGVCQFDMYGYRQHIDPRELARCLSLDPWPVDDGDDDEGTH